MRRAGRSKDWRSSRSIEWKKRLASCARLDIHSTQARYARYAWRFPERPSFFRAKQDVPRCISIGVLRVAALEAFEQRLGLSVLERDAPAATALLRGERRRHGHQRGAAPGRQAVHRTTSQTPLTPSCGRRAPLHHHPSRTASPRGAPRPAGFGWSTAARFGRPLNCRRESWQSARRRGRPCPWAAADPKCRYHRRDGPPSSGT